MILVHVAVRKSSRSVVESKIRNLIFIDLAIDLLYVLNPNIDISIHLNSGLSSLTKETRTREERVERSSLNFSDQFDLKVSEHIFYEIDYYLKFLNLCKFVKRAF